MKRLLSVLCALSFVAIINCGSSGGGSSDLTTDQINNISSALTGAMTSVYSDWGSAYPTAIEAAVSSFSMSCSDTTCDCSASGSGTYACPLGGHITYSGNYTLNCTQVCTAGATNYCCGHYTTAMSMTFQVSDPTNNLNDCTVGNDGTDDVIVDGAIYLTVSGTDAALSASIDGTLGINKRGPTGGLVPITDDCSIFISYPSGGSPSGTICGFAVSSVDVNSSPLVKF